MKAVAYLLLTNHETHVHVRLNTSKAVHGGPDDIEATIRDYIFDNRIDCLAQLHFPCEEVVHLYIVIVELGITIAHHKTGTWRGS